jgi:hypothetical protein
MSCTAPREQRAATFVGAQCYHGSRRLLRAVAGLAANDGKPCSDGRSTLLPTVPNLAPMGGRHCSDERPALLRWAAGLATGGGRSCYFCLPALLHGGVGGAARGGLFCYHRGRELLQILRGRWAPPKPGHRCSNRRSPTSSPEVVVARIIGGATMVLQAGATSGCCLRSGGAGSVGRRRVVRTEF